MKLSNQHEGWQDKQMWTLTHSCICLPCLMHSSTMSCMFTAHLTHSTSHSQHISLIYVLSIFR